jgi:hypothetical protein
MRRARVPSGRLDGVAAAWAAADDARLRARRGVAWDIVGGCQYKNDAFPVCWWFNDAVQPRH